ncbi:MAG: hypothetical protein KatS3mg076_0371 [Candidatus Binatia bacterium]|nr:MAG: hypothetical protein KatS3mg076_0371 [Candidatus Binatia bacterium]
MRRRCLELAASLASSIVLVSVATAAGPLSLLGAEVRPFFSDRVRGEFVDWFGPAPASAPRGAERYDFFANRLRAGFRVSAGKAEWTLTLQDTRLENLPSDASPPESAVGNLGPGALYFSHTRATSQGETFLKEAFLRWRDPLGVGGLELLGGRFEYADGLEVRPRNPTLAWLKSARISQRLVGPFGFTHVTRSFDGLRIDYDLRSVRWTVLGVRPTRGGFEVSANRELDVWLAGASATYSGPESLDARLFYFYYRDERDRAVKVDNRSVSERREDSGSVDIHTVGGHVLGVRPLGPGRVDGLFWVAGQAGSWGRLDHVAWAYGLEGGYRWPSWPFGPWVRAGLFRSSGDDDAGDGTHETFFQMLPTARIYAQFPFFNLMNNQDFFAQLLLRPSPVLSLRLDYHWLRLTEARDLWYAGGGATSDTVFGFAGLPSGGGRDLGHLVDLAVTWSPLDWLEVYAYYGHAFGEDVVGENFADSDADYGYVEVTVSYGR